MLDRFARGRDSAARTEKEASGFAGHVAVGVGFLRERERLAGVLSETVAADDVRALHQPLIGESERGRAACADDRRFDLTEETADLFLRLLLLRRLVRASGESLR